jgi:hypothetical protein
MTGSQRMSVLRAAIGLSFLIAACRSSGPVRTGPLPTAHSCYRMTGPLLQPAEAVSPAAVWLLLSDQSPKRVGARSYDAVILTNGIYTRAAWHRIAGDSLLVEWASPSGAHTVKFHSGAERIDGLAAVEPSAAARGGPISGTRGDCALLATGDPAAVSHVP